MIFSLQSLVGKVNTLLDRLTATRAGYLDRLDAAISSRASAATWTSTVAGRIDAAISSRAAAPTIQTGWLSQTASSGSGEDALYSNITITAVSAVANCVVLVQGPGLCSYSSGSTYYYNAWPAHGRLTSTTNLRISALAGGSEYPGVGIAAGDRFAVRWTVIDYGG